MRQVWVKTSSTYLEWETCYITSNHHPADVYPHANPKNKEAFLRRIHEIREMQGIDRYTGETAGAIFRSQSIPGNQLMLQDETFPTYYLPRFQLSPATAGAGVPTTTTETTLSQDISHMLDNITNEED